MQSCLSAVLLGLSMPALAQQGSALPAAADLRLPGMVEYMASFGEAVRTGTTGSYVFFLGDKGQPIWAAYWIGPQAIILFPDGIVAPGPANGLMVDRMLLPGAIVSSYVFSAMLIGYSSLPPLPSTGEPAEIREEPYYLVLGKSKPDPHEQMIFGWTGHATVTKRSGSYAAWSYEMRNGFWPTYDGPKRVPDSQERVFLPALGVDVEKEIWERATDVVTGTGLTSSSDLAFVVWMAQAGEGKTRQCLAELRANPDTQAFLAGFAQLEKRNEGLIWVGQSDTLTFGMQAYTALEDRYHTAKRFTACIEASP